MSNKLPVQQMTLKSRITLFFSESLTANLPRLRRKWLNQDPNNREPLAKQNRVCHLHRWSHNPDEKTNLTIASGGKKKARGDQKERPPLEDGGCLRFQTGGCMAVWPWRSKVLPCPPAGTGPRCLAGQDGTEGHCADLHVFLSVWRTPVYLT